MKTAIIGYGRMGKTIEKLLLERGHEVVARFNREGIDKDQLKKAEVAIEFSRPEAVVGNLARCFEAGVPVVCGTTGWLAQFDEVSEMCRQQQGGLLYSSNFSVGVNLFFALNKKLASLMNAYPDYEVAIDEIHHTQKLDAPSGTAISLAEQIIEELERKEGWSMEDVSEAKHLHIEAKRLNDVPGTHRVSYQSPIDTIEITHTAHSRKGFALGAVVAAEFLLGRQGIFSMTDVLNF